MGNPAQPKEIVIIIGAMKSGTTSLFHYLEQHPQIAASRLKEPGFFCSDDRWAKGIDWYYSLWDFKPGEHRLAMEATTDYTKQPLFPETVERMKSLSDIKFKFIYIMRHPLKRLESQALHVARTKTESCFVPPIDTDYSFSNGIAENLVEFSKYAMQLDRFTEHFDNDSLFLTTLEELNEEPQTVMAEITKFLEITPHDFQHTAETHNAANTKNRPNQIHKLFSSIKWLRSLYHGLVGENFRLTLYNIFGSTTGLDNSSRFVLNADEQFDVKTQLKPDLIKLRDRYGLDGAVVWDLNYINDE